MSAVGLIDVDVKQKADNKLILEFSLSWILLERILSALLPVNPKVLRDVWYLETWGSGAMEGSWNSCSVDTQAVGNLWLCRRETAMREWTPPGCFFSSYHISFLIGMTSVGIMYSWIFAKNGCMLAKLSSLTKWVLSLGHLWTTLASFCEWMKSGSESAWEIKQEMNPPVGVCIMKSYLIWVEWDWGKFFGNLL